MGNTLVRRASRVKQNMEIPSHKLLRPIGEGGFGEVWMARTVTGKLRAVKIVRRERFEKDGLGKEQVDRLFRLEFDGVRGFEDLASQNPSLIHIHTVGRGELGEVFYYVMPLADHAGTEKPCQEDEIESYHPLTLGEMIDRQGAMTLNQANDLLAEICAGVASLHRAGLMHRDISSPNILFINGKPVVADPGLTSVDTDELPAVSRGFSPPEGHSSPSSDVYSLGKLYYHMISGLHPADHYPMLPEAVYRDENFGHSVELLDRCCNPSPERRFSDAAELLGFLAPEDSFIQPARKIKPWLWAMGIGLLGGLAWLAYTSGQSVANPGEIDTALPPSSVEIKDGMLFVFAEHEGKLLWRKNLGVPLLQAGVVDLDEDGSPEVICAIRDTGSKETGRLLVYNADGSLRWQHDTTLDFQNYRGFGSDRMALFGFKAENWDGQAGKELVLIARNVENWYPTALQFLNTEGKLTACYWHPGHIHPEQIKFFRETPESMPMLSFTGLNNRLSVPPSKYSVKLPAKDLKWRTTIGLLNPRQVGHHAAPPGQGVLKGKDSMSQWYRILDPQHARTRSVHCEDTNHDGKNELVIWADFGERDHFPEKRINYCEVIDFQGNTLETKTGDGHMIPARIRVPEEKDVRIPAK